MSDLLDKIGLLMSKAEASDNEHEREAFMSKAQELATLSSIDLEVARQRQTDKNKREVPIKKHRSMLPEGVRTLRRHFIDLLFAITEANDVRWTYWSGDKHLPVSMYGFPSDIEVCELLFGSLSVQMVSSADAYIKTKAYKGETYLTDDQWGCEVSKPVDARVARNQFYNGYVTAVHLRLRQARDEAAKAQVQTTSGESTSGALVLKSKRDEVYEFYSTHSGKVRSSGSSFNYRSGGSAGTAGRAAGQSARLGAARGIGSRAGAIS